MDRYSRLLQLSNFTEKDLEVLHSKKVLILGVGGVGQHVATYLVTNGITKLTIVDFDNVEISNLNRQILLTEEDIGKGKVNVVKKALNARNSNALIETIECKIDESNISKIIDHKYDVVIDCLDNWTGKLIISKECLKQRIPLLHIGVDGMRGQYVIFENTSLHSIVNNDIINAPKEGVMGPMVGAVSSLAAVHLLNYLLKKDEPDGLHYLDFESHQFSKIKIPRE